METSSAELAAEWVDLLVGDENPFKQIPDKKVDETYAIAHYYYSKGQYSDALTYFQILVTARPLEPKFWKGLGATLQMKQDFAGALGCYDKAQLLNGEQPDPYLYVHAANCFYSLDQKDNALGALEAAKQWAKKNNDRRILSHTREMKSLWSN